MENWAFSLQGALLLVLFQCSHTIEHMLTDKAHGNLSALMDGCPETANVVDLNSEGEPAMDSARETAASQVPVGSSILVKPGQKVSHSPHTPSQVDSELASAGAGKMTAQ